MVEPFDVLMENSQLVTNGQLWKKKQGSLQIAMSLWPRLPAMLGAKQRSESASDSSTEVSFLPRSLYLKPRLSICESLLQVGPRADRYKCI